MASFMCSVMLLSGGFYLCMGHYVGIILLIFGTLFAPMMLWDIIEWSSFRNNLKQAKKYGKRYDGKIRGYIIHGEEHFYRVKGAEAREVKLKYILEIEIEEKRKIIHTPELRYNPASVLKSNQCTVYQYENEYYVQDFDLRRKHTDETAEIPRKKIKVDRARWEQ